MKAEFLSKLKEIKSDKAKELISLLESITDETPQNERREYFEQVKDLLEAERTANNTREILRTALKDKFKSEYGPYIIDHSAEYVYFQLDNDKYYKADYSYDEFNKPMIGSPIEVKMKTVYEPVMESTKQIQGNFTKLIEKKANSDGTIPIKIISPGWGSSGYYSKEVLQRDAGIYKEGTKMYLDHPTVTEELERPERSLKDLAGVLVENGKYLENGPDGEGVYAKAKLFGGYKESIEEMSDYIGISHVALGKAVNGEADGQSGTIIESLNMAQSVDFVTEPGAGGKITELFESSRNKFKEMAEKNEDLQKLQESVRTLQESNDNLKKENERLKEKALLSDATDFVNGQLKEAELPEVTKSRLAKNLASNPVTIDGKIDEVKYKEAIDKAVKEEAEYLGKLSESGKITGMGETEKEDFNDKKFEESLSGSLTDLGLGEDFVKIAVKGR